METGEEALWDPWRDEAHFTSPPLPFLNSRTYCASRLHYSPKGIYIAAKIHHMLGSNVMFCIISLVLLWPRDSFVPKLGVFV